MSKPLNMRASLSDYGLMTPGPHSVTYIPTLRGGSHVPRARIAPVIQTEAESANKVREHMKQERDLLFQAHLLKRRRPEPVTGPDTTQPVRARLPLNIQSEEDRDNEVRAHMQKERSLLFRAFTDDLNAERLRQSTVCDHPPSEPGRRVPAPVVHARPSDKSDIEMASETETLLSIASHQVEYSTGVCPIIERQWREVTEDVRYELMRAWPVINILTSDIVVSTTHDVVRIRTLDAGTHTGGTIRYVTPIRTWAYTIANGTEVLEAHPPVPTPIHLLPKLAVMMGGSNYTKNQMELRLTLLWAVPSAAITLRGPRVTLHEDVVRQYDDRGVILSYRAGVTWNGNECVCCQASECKGPMGITASRFTRTIAMRCAAGATPRVHRMSKLEYHYLFGGPKPDSQTEPIWLRPGHGQHCELDLYGDGSVHHPEHRYSSEAKLSPPRQPHHDPAEPGQARAQRNGPRPQPC